MVLEVDRVAVGVPRGPRIAVDRDPGAIGSAWVVVGKLGLAWFADIPSKDGLVGNPLVVDGVAYAGGAIVPVVVVMVEPVLGLGVPLQERLELRVSVGYPIEEG